MIKIDKDNFNHYLNNFLPYLCEKLEYELVCIRHIYVGEEAKDFVKKYYNKNKKPAGVFLNIGNLNENFHIDYKDHELYDSILQYGVVCVLDCNLTTFIHEVVHAVQYQVESKKVFFNVYDGKSIYYKYYKKYYYDYPLELEAQLFSLEYYKKFTDSKIDLIYLIEKFIFYYTIYMNRIDQFFDSNYKDKYSIIEIERKLVLNKFRNKL